VPLAKPSEPFQIEVHDPLVAPHRLGPRACRAGLEGVTWSRWSHGDVLKVSIVESDRDSGIAAPFDAHHGTARSNANVFSCDLIDVGVKLNRRVVVHMAGSYMAQKRHQIVVLLQRPVSFAGAGRPHHERLVPPRRKLGFQIAVGLLPGALCAVAQRTPAARMPFTSRS
jgi:hypothetical protein